MHTRLIIAALVPLVLCSCGPKPKHLFHDPSFSSASMRTGGIALLGTVGLSPREDKDPELQRLFDSVLYTELSQPLTEVHIWTVDSTRRVLGDFNFRWMRIVLDEDDQLDSDCRSRLDELGSSFPVYLLVAREIESRTWTEDDESGSSARTFRKVTMKILVFDTRTARLVWATNVTLTKSNSGSTSPGLVEQAIEDVTGFSTTPKRVPPPSYWPMLGPIFRQAGEELAKIP